MLLSQRPRLVTSLVLLLAASAASPAAATAQESGPKGSRPNILFIFCDDHAPHAIGAYNGWLKSREPHAGIDKLARDGMTFERSFCSNSICGPSRAVIMSGKHSHKNGFMNNGNRSIGISRSFPKLLQKAGYQTAIYGKSHLKGHPQGFDDWAVLPGQGLYYNPDMIFAEGNDASRAIARTS